MEFPNLGKHCYVQTCNKLDFLPVKCDACHNIFCCDHMTYKSHECHSAFKKDVQVPVCPLCNMPVANKKGTLPDIAVGRHIDNDCKSDNKKVFSNKCSMNGCRVKEIVPIVCTECNKNYCLKHRHCADHNCTRHHNIASKLGERSRTSNVVSLIQGNMNEDEALARALHMSMLEESSRRPPSTRSNNNCRVS